MSSVGKMFSSWISQSFFWSTVMSSYSVLLLLCCLQCVFQNSLAVRFVHPSFGSEPAPHEESQRRYYLPPFILSCCALVFWGFRLFRGEWVQFIFSSLDDFSSTSISSTSPSSRRAASLWLWSVMLAGSLFHKWTYIYFCIHVYFLGIFSYL